MYNRRTKKLPQIIIVQLSVVLLITSMALSILFYAYGYRFNFHNFKIIKTGILQVVSYPKIADVYLNGDKKNSKTPYAINLTAGYYNIEIQKEGYAPWSISAKVESELVTDFKNVVLFKQNPQVSDLTDNRKIDILNSPNEMLAQKKNPNLVYDSYELWYKTKLVTRFSSAIGHAILYPDENHIIYQQGKEIRIIEISGTNDTLLVEMSSDRLTNLATNNKGEELYYVEDGAYKMAVIR